MHDRTVPGERGACRGTDPRAARPPRLVAAARQATDQLYHPEEG